MSCLVISIVLIAFTESFINHDISESPLVELTEGTQADIEYNVAQIFDSCNEEDFYRILGNDYPTEDIREILENESIPEEDRYWLDCRLRSRIAQATCRLFNEDGDQIQLDAEWIVPGECYWQEHLMVKKIGNGLLSTVMAGNNPEVSLVYNLFGERIGFLGSISYNVKLSRNGSPGVIQGGGRNTGFPCGPDLFIEIIDLHGEIDKIQIEDPSLFSNNSNAISNDGSIIAYNTYNLWNLTESYIIICDTNCNEVMRVKVQGVITNIVISPDNRFVAFSDAEEEFSGVLDLHTKEMFVTTCGGRGLPYFSGNSRYAVLPGVFSISECFLVDLCARTACRFSNSNIQQLDGKYNGDWYISNDGNIIAVGNLVFWREVLIFRDEALRQCVLSPSGYFMLVENYPVRQGNENRFQYSLYCITDCTGGC